MIGRKRLPLLALVVLALLLGHDAVMAANPHGQASSHERHEVMEQEASSCLAIVGARIDRPDSPVPADGALDVSVVLARIPAQPAEAIVWRDAPGHPPDVWRALLQVFLN